jgi:hypothetical protein
MSTIFPLPSSPHWAPTTTVTAMMSVFPGWIDGEPRREKKISDPAAW